jgi:hypothetical protein
MKRRTEIGLRRRSVSVLLVCADASTGSAPDLCHRRAAPPDFERWRWRLLAWGCFGVLGQGHHHPRDAYELNNPTQESNASRRGDVPEPKATIGTDTCPRLP